MLAPSEFTYDASSAISLGRRDQQEDAVIADFAAGAGIGFAVLADGMGGHAAGDVASKIVVTEVFSEIKMQAGDPVALQASISAILRDAVISANDCVRLHADTCPETQGMGATLVAPVLLGDNLYWISVGDSPLYLFRDGELSRLNEDHSLTPQIDYLVSNGMLAPEEARNHPDRSCLTSVLIGDDIPQIDCPAEPLSMQHGDILLVASDGLQFLEEDRIAQLVAACATRSSAEISRALLRELEHLDDPDQDNTSLCVIKVAQKGVRANHAADRVPLEPPSRVRRRWKTVNVVAATTKSKTTLAYRVKAEKTA